MRTILRHLFPKTVLVLALSLMLLLSLQACQKKTPPPPGTAPETSKGSAPSMGQAAPLFQTQDYTGKAFNLKDYQGKVVFLDFFATWCPPCRAEIPALEKLHQAYGSQGLTMVGISAESGDKVLPFTKTMGMSYTVLQGSPELFTTYGVSSIPAGFLLDKSGKIVYTAVGFGPGEDAKIEAAIKSALAGKVS